MNNVFLENEIIDLKRNNIRFLIRQYFWNGSISLK